MRVQQNGLGSRPFAIQRRPKGEENTTNHFHMISLVVVGCEEKKKTNEKYTIAQWGLLYMLRINTSTVVNQTILWSIEKKGGWQKRRKNVCSLCLRCAIEPIMTRFFFSCVSPSFTHCTNTNERNISARN